MTAASQRDAAPPGSESECSFPRSFTPAEGVRPSAADITLKYRKKVCVGVGGVECQLFAFGESRWVTFVHPL